MSFSKDLFGGKKKPEPSDNRTQLSESLEREFEQTIGAVRSLSRKQQLKNLLACVAQNASDETLQQSVDEYDHISGNAFDLMWPLFEKALSDSTSIGSLAARLGPMVRPLRWDDPPGFGSSRAIDIATFYESFARYVRLSNRVSEGLKVVPLIEALANRMNRETDAEQLGRLAMSLAWIGETQLSEELFEKALKLAHADERVLQMVRDGNVMAENRPGYVSLRHVLSYCKRAKKAPMRRD